MEIERVDVLELDDSQLDDVVAGAQVTPAVCIE